MTIGRDRLVAYISLALMPFLFSTNMVIGRFAAATVEPWTLAFLRWFIASAVLCLIARHDLRLHWPAYRRLWPWMALIGFLAMWICGGLVYKALKITTATNGSLIYATTAIFILLFEWIFRGRPISLRDLSGVALCMAGVLVIIGSGSMERLLGLTFNGGDLLFAVAMISWAAYSVMLKRPDIQALPTLSTFAVFAVWGTIWLAPLAIWEMAEAGTIPTSASAWVSIVGAALVPSVLAFSAYQYGIKVLGATIGGLFAYLLLPAGVLMAVIFLGERLEPFHIAGSVLIMGGILVATAPLGRKAAA